MKRPYDFNGQQIMGEEIEFETEREGFNIYILHDGTKLKFKAIVQKVIRLDAYKQDGEPMYMVHSTQIASTDVPDSLKKKPE